MLTSHELLGFMSPNLATEILAYAFESDKPLYKATLQAVAEARKLRMYEPRHVFVGSFLRREATLSRSSATRPKCTGRMPKASKAGLPGEMEAKTRTGRPFRSAVAVIARIGGCGGSQHPILASERFLGWQLRMTPALRRQRSHVRIVSGAPYNQLLSLSVLM